MLQFSNKIIKKTSIEHDLDCFILIRIVSIVYLAVQDKVITAFELENNNKFGITLYMHSMI